MHFRWIEDKPVAERLIEIWPNIVKVVESWEKMTKSKRPSCKSYLSVVEAVKDPLMVAKLQFFSFFAGQFKPFLVAYQTDQPMVPFLYQDLLKLIRKIMQIVVKPDVLEKCESGSDLKNVDLSNKSVFLKTRNINIGFAARAFINDLRKKDAVSKAKLADFFNGVILFVTESLVKMFEKSPIGSVVALHPSVFNPIYIATEKAEVLQSKMQKLLSHLLKLKVFTSNVCDSAFNEYGEFIGDELRRIKFQEFDRSESPLDDFFFKVVDIKKHKNLVNVVKLILTLSHGQAAVERGFSVNKSILENNMKEDSIVARKLIRDHMLAHSLSPESFIITKPLISSCLSAHRKYQDHLQSIKDAEGREAESKKVKILIEEINDTVIKREKLIKTSESLDSDFVSLVKEAEFEKDTTVVLHLISKANALKRKSEELKRDAKKLDETIELLNAKKKKLQ